MWWIDGCGGLTSPAGVAMMDHDRPRITEDLADAILSEDNSLIRDLKSEDLEMLLS